MAYFTSDFSKFFRELAANNNRDWFNENKKRYENSVKKPFAAFIADVIDAVKQYEPDLNLEVKDAVFRIYWDIRFSKDKSPYKLYAGGVVCLGGRKHMSRPGLYMHMGGEETMIAGGSYKPDKEELGRIRNAIVADSKRLDKLLSESKFKKTFGGLYDGEKNKILPKGFKPYADELPVLFNKQFFFMAKYEDSKLMEREDLLDFVMGHYRAGQNMNAFLAEATENN